MHRRKILFIGLILVMLATAAFVGGCYPVTETTTADGTESTTSPWSSLLPMIIFIVVLFGLMYFFTIRPQRKRQQETQKMLQSLHQGDKIVTNAGIYGRIDAVYEDSYLIETESGATVRIAKWAIIGKQSEEAPKDS
ncbi:MAG: preprotein translocase subunit YajC [Dehalococcoidales bacterium]|nr:preprotein translocase subunit YajC [Dehalococcoidales bacterium]